MADGQPLLIGRRNDSTLGTILDQDVHTVGPTSATFSVNNGGKFGISGTGGEIGISGSGQVVGVYGEAGAGGSGVRGISVQNREDAPSTLPAGVAGSSVVNPGVFGISLNDAGVHGTSNIEAGVHGISSSAAGVRGESETGVGVQGTTAHGSAAVKGVSGFDIGVVGIQGAGVDPRTIGVFGVAGTSDLTPGVLGQSNSGVGVQGTSNSAAGVRGESATGVGVHGSSTGGIAGQFDGTTIVNGDLVLGTSGNKLQIRAGDGAGTVQLNNGSAVVPSTAINGNSIIIAIVQTPGTNGPPGNIYVSARNSGTNFTIQSTNGNDNSTVGWILVELI